MPVSTGKMYLGDVQISGGVQTLSTPTISLSDNTISWSAITNAEFYLVYKDNAIYSVVNTNSYNLSGVVGTYKIKAIASGYNFSEFSNSVSVTLPKPTDLTGTKWQFNLPMRSIGVDGIYTFNYTLSPIASAYSQFAGTLIKMQIWSSDNDCRVFNSSTHVTLQSAMFTNTPYILTIIGGADVTNSNLINYLWANATRIA